MRTLHEILDLEHGQVVAQALVAATRTVPDRQHVHSLHAWFHRPPRVDDWLFYDIEAVAHRDDRILVSAKVFDRAGRCVATVAQEMLARAAS